MTFIFKQIFGHLKKYISYKYIYNNNILNIFRPLVFFQNKKKFCKIIKSITPRILYQSAKIKFKNIKLIYIIL